MSNKNYEYQLNLPLGTEFVKKMTDLIDKLENINNNNLSVKIDLSAYMTSLEIVRDFQKKLVSGQNIKTINGQKVLGSGNIEIDTGVNPSVIGNLSDLTTSTKTNIVSAINEIDKLISDIEKDYANTNYVDDKVNEINSKIASLTNQVNTLSTSINTVKSDLNGVKNRVTTIENAYVKNVTYQDGTGIFTFTMQDGTTKKFDLAIEKVVANFEYDTENNSLILTLADGTQQVVPITALVGDYDGVDGDVIKVDVSGDNLISAELKGKTINETYLSDDVISKINQGVEAKTKVDDVDERLTVVENEYVKSVNIDENGKLTITLQDGTQKTIEVSSGTGVKGFEVVSVSGVPTDLTGYTVAVPSGWSSSSGYGLFSLNYVLSGNSCTDLHIGYAQYGGLVESENDYICCILPSGVGINYYSDGIDLTFYITDGNDVANSKLIQWFVNNGATFTKTDGTAESVIRLTLENDTTFDIPLSDIVPDSYTKEEADSTFATKNELSTTNSNVSGLDTRTAAIEKSYVKSVTYDNDTGIFVFTKQDGSVQTFDLAIEKVVVNFEYVEERITDLTGATITWNDSAFYIDINKKFNINYNYISPYDGSVVNREGLTFSNSSARFTIYVPDASGLTFYYYDYEDNTYNFNETVASKTWNIVDGDDASNSELCAFIQENAIIEGGTKSPAGLQLTLADGTTQFVPLSSFISDSYTKEEANLIFASKDYAYNKAESDENYAKSSDFNVLNNNFKTVQTNVTTLQTEVSTLQSNVTTLQSDVAQNQEQVGALNEKSTDHENRITTLEQNQGSGGSTSSVSAFITESVVVSEFSALETAQGAYTHFVDITLTNSLDTMTSIELVNNNPVLFSTYGFAIASASGTSVVVYSIGKPSEDVTLTFEMHETVEVWDGSYSEGETVSLINFTIDGTSYEAEDGMTWEEWVASDYNIDGYTISSSFNSIKSTTGKYVHYSGNTELYSATIVSGRDYTLVTSISGGAG